jgi:hypothetical protein
MAAVVTQNAEILFADTGGNIGKMSIKDIKASAAADLTKLLGVATYFHGFSNAAIRAYSLGTWTKNAYAGSTSPTGLNSLKSAVTIHFTYNSAPIRSVIFLPNPADAHLEMVTGEGMRILPASLATLTSALSSLAGFTVTATEGKLVSKSWKRQGSPGGSSVAFEDENGKIAFMTIPAMIVSAAGALDTFAAAMNSAAYSASRVVQTCYLSKQEALPDPTTGIGLAIEDDDNKKFTAISVRAVLKFSYVENYARKYIHATLPAPIYTAIGKSGSTYVYDAGVGQLHADELSTFIDRELTFVGSRVDGVLLD